MKLLKLPILIILMSITLTSLYAMEREGYRDIQSEINSANNLIARIGLNRWLEANGFYKSFRIPNATIPQTQLLHNAIESKDWQKVKGLINKFGNRVIAQGSNDSATNPPDSSDTYSFAESNNAPWEILILIKNYGGKKMVGGRTVRGFEG